MTLADELLRLFRDDERGGFFQTGSDAEALVLRPKELYDNATPSGNSVAADVLLRLALFTGDAGYEHAGVSALRLVRDAMAGAPTGFGQALCALDLYVGPSNEVAIVGDPSSDDTRALVAEVTGAVYRPNVVMAVAARRRRARRVGGRAAARPRRDRRRSRPRTSASDSRANCPRRMSPRCDLNSTGERLSWADAEAGRSRSLVHGLTRSR